MGSDTNQTVGEPTQATQPMQTQGSSDVSAISEPDASSKKKSHHLLMIFILIALVVIFLLLIYAISANNEVSRMQTETQTQESGVSPVTDKVILNPSPEAETADDVEISDIEGDIESLDRELEEL